jgi:hypothetical protein
MVGGIAIGLPGPTVGLVPRRDCMNTSIKCGRRRTSCLRIVSPRSPRLGTEADQARFDGARFVTFTFHQVGGSLPNDYVACLLASRDGSLWVETTARLLQCRDGKFNNLRGTSDLGQTPIADIEEESDGTIWNRGSRQTLSLAERCYRAI